MSLPLRPLSFRPPKPTSLTTTAPPLNHPPGDDSTHSFGEPALVASEMDLANTLLASAVAMRKARFVRDTTNYLQSTARPARDVFTRPDALVASVVVVPLVHGDGPPRAALYLSLEAPSDFINIQAPLLVRKDEWGWGLISCFASWALLWSSYLPAHPLPSTPRPPTPIKPGLHQLRHPTGPPQAGGPPGRDLVRGSRHQIALDQAGRAAPQVAPGPRLRRRQRPRVAAPRARLGRQRRAADARRQQPERRGGTGPRRARRAAGAERRGGVGGRL